MAVTTNNPADEKEDVMMVETVQDDVEGNPEKAPRVFHVDGFNVLGLSAEDAEFYENYSAVERKKTMHKVIPKAYLPPLIESRAYTLLP